MGSAHPLNAPYQAFETADRWIVVGGANARNWARMLEAIEAPQLAQDPRFKDNAGRMANLEALVAELTARFRKKPSAHWLQVLEEKGVPCGPVNDMLQALADPQTRAREMVTTVQHVTLGPVETIGLPVKFSGTPGKVRTGAPLYGQHTREVLSEYGFNDAEIAALEAEGAVIAAMPPGKAQGKVA
jgi:crotonobetainyl-CoA:carnitine CoA-transferase CaiB-like acyl-CoA transferase